MLRPAVRPAGRAAVRRAVRSAVRASLVRAVSVRAVSVRAVGARAIGVRAVGVGVRVRYCRESHRAATALPLPINGALGPEVPETRLADVIANALPARRAAGPGLFRPGPSRPGP